MNYALNKAMIFAKKAHGNQLRKYTNEPYICHPIGVMGIVYTVTDNEDMLAAAILHDVVEDTDYSIDDIFSNFGTQIGSMVEELTDVSKPTDGNRKTRKALDRHHISRASSASKTIKLADLIDNTKSIISFDPDFAKVYMHEKKRLLEVLTEGDKVLLAIAKGLIKRYYEVRNE